MVNVGAILSKMVKGFLDDGLTDFSKVLSVNLLRVGLGFRRPQKHGGPMTVAASST
jgi:hypothetical protein